MTRKRTVSVPSRRARRGPGGFARGLTARTPRAAAWAILLAGLCLACAHRAEPGHRAVLLMRWMEAPRRHGPSAQADPADCAKFERFLSYEQSGAAPFPEVRAQLREGDVIAYRMTRRAVVRETLLGHVNTVGYGLLKYGHLAILVEDDDAAATGGLRLFSSQSFIGPNTREGIETLEHHDWDAYRLDHWDRVDARRLHEFADVVDARTGHWYGYDFSGMFGLWNANAFPEDPKRVGHEYICSTVVVAALYYSGLQLDAVRRKGYLDLCTPLQVVSSRGVIVAPPPVALATTDTPTSQTTVINPATAQPPEPPR